MRYKLESESRDQDDDHHSDDDADDDIYISAIWRGADDNNVSLELHSNFVIISWSESENHLSMGTRPLYSSCSSQCSTTGVAKAVVCVILSVGWCI